MFDLGKLVKLSRHRMPKAAAALRVDVKLEVEKEVFSLLTSFEGLVQWYWL